MARFSISVADDLLRKADRTAKQLGVSRSRLFSIALTEFLKQRRNAELLDQINRAYADSPDASERRLLVGMKAKFRAAVRDRW